MSPWLSYIDGKIGTFLADFGTPYQKYSPCKFSQLKESKQNVTHNYITGNWCHLDRTWYKLPEFHYFLTLHSSSDLKIVKQIFLLMYAAT